MCTVTCRNYHKAATALKALRAEAVQHSRGASFNDTLKELRTLFESSQQHKKFWQLLVDQQVSLVSDDEAPGSGVSAPEAEDFLKHDTSHGQARCSSCIDRLTICTLSIFQTHC